MSLMGSLGLDSVEADPNAIADGTYKAVVFKSEYVVSKKDDVFHVITYKVIDGPRKGAQKAEWFKLGTDPVREGPGNVLVGMTPTMTEQAKPWYKKRWVDLGVPEAEVATADPSRLVGINVDFGVKTKDGYQNITFATASAEGTATTPTEGAVSTDQAPAGRL